MDIDDDNTPAPENIPTPSNDSGQNNEAFLLNISRHDGIPSILQTFEILFPKVYAEEVIIRETNKKIQENKLTYG